MAKRTTNKSALRGRMFVAILQIQQTHPTLRIMQIIGNAFDGIESDYHYYKTDEELVAALEAYARSHSQPAKNESRG